MKKLIFFIMIAMLCAFVGCAEDYTTMTVEELLDARAKIDQALYEHDCTTILLPGEYLVGVDIPAGKYCVERHDNSDSVGTWYVHIEAYDGAREEYEDLYDKAAESNSNDYPRLDDYLKRNFLYFDEEKVGISLEDGQILFIEFNTSKQTSSVLTISKVSPLFTD